MPKNADNKTGVFSQSRIDRSGWKTVRVGEIGEMFKGRGFSMKDTVSSGTPCTMYGDIYVKYGERFWTTDYRLSKELADKCPSIRHGDLLFTLSGETAEEIGKCAGFLGNDSVCIGGDILALRPRREYDPEFLCYAMNSPNCIRQKSQFGQGDAVVHISQANLAQVVIQIPTLGEQRRIASAIAAVDARLDALSALAAKQEAIKKSTLSLLMQPKAGWRTVRLGDVCDNFSGLTYYPEQVSTVGTLVLRSSNIQDGHLIYHDNVFVSTSIPDHAKVRRGDLLVCVRNGSKSLIGKSAVITAEAEKMAFGAFMTILRAKEIGQGINQPFLSYAWQTRTIQDQIQESLGATINQITNSDIRYFEINVPSLSEQRQIAESLSGIDEAIQKTRAERKKVESMKAGLMRHFFG